MITRIHFLKTILFFLMAGLFYGHASSFTSNLGMGKSSSDSIAKKVVFVIIDGVSADMLQKAHTPFLDNISRRGGFTKAYVGGKKGGFSETPTISAVGYNSLLTGTWANKHNVWDNAITSPNYHYPTIFRIFKDNHPNGKTAIFSTWFDNRTKLIGEGLPATGGLKVDYAFDGFELDTINFPHDDQRLFIKNIDEKVAKEAARYIGEEGPDLSWVYLEFTDDMGHKYGDSPQLYDAIAFEDGLLGEIWQSISERQESFEEDWLLIVTTDHGRYAKDGKGHGGQSDRERSTWIVTNAENTNPYFQEHTPAVIDIFPTITRFMNLKLDEAVSFEIDGIPLTGAVDVYGLEAEKEGTEIKLTWNCLGTDSREAAIYIARTNEFANGNIDKYDLVGEVIIDKKIFTISSVADSKFYKIVLKSPNHLLNTWITED